MLLALSCFYFVHSKSRKKGIFILAYKCPCEEFYWDSYHRIKELPSRIKPLSPLLICSSPINWKLRGKLAPAILLTASLGTTEQFRDYYIYHENCLSQKITQLSTIKSCSFWAKFTHDFHCRPGKSKTSGCIKQRLRN